jgi:hypothetical protein
MKEWKELGCGAVCTAVEASEVDLNGLTPHYARVFIPAAARVRVTVAVATDEQVVFDGSIAPESNKAGVLEIRLRRCLDAQAMPAQPEDSVTKTEAEIGM